MKVRTTLLNLGKLLRPRVLISVPLLMIGLVMWNSKSNFVPIMFPAHGEYFWNIGGSNDNLTGSHDVVGARPKYCSILEKLDGYLLISGSIQTTSLRDQVFFQTADSEDGIFFELSSEDANLVRLGVHLKDDTTALIGFKSQMSLRKFNYAILLSNNGVVRIVGDKRDIRVMVGPMKPSCQNVIFGLGNGSGEFQGTIFAYISVGTNLKEINKRLDDYLALTERNVPSTLYQWPLYSGILLLLFGFPRRKRSTNN